jgi:MFS family permease
MGRFQFFAFLVLQLLVSPNGFLLYNVSFLLMRPELQCFSQVTKQWATCTRDLACQAHASNLTHYQINYDTSLTNLVTDSHLECESDTSLLSVGVWFFLGVFFSFIIWIRCSDTLSRKPIILLGATLQLLAYSGVVFYAKTLAYLHLYYFLLGLGTVISTSTGYNYMIEFTPRHAKIVVGTLFISLQIIPAMVMPMYLMLVEGDTQNVVWVGYLCCMGGIGLMVVGMPESPQYLFAMERFLECQESINYIAKFNGSEKRCDMKRLHLEKQLSEMHIEVQNRESQFRWFLD